MTLFQLTELRDSTYREPTFPEKRCATCKYFDSDLHCSFIGSFPRPGDFETTEAFDKYSNEFIEQEKIVRPYGSCDAWEKLNQCQK